jgi:mRNA interferase YafQ
LAAGEPLPTSYRDHALKGEFHGFRDCHLEPDWLLIYAQNKQTLQLVRTGTHSDLVD